MKAAIVTDGSSGTGLAVAHELAGRGYALVLVYLEDQRQAEAAIDEIAAAHGTALAVRADIADDLDVQRLFAETVAAYGRVDLVVHSTGKDAAVLSRHLPEDAALVNASLI